MLLQRTCCFADAEHFSLFVESATRRLFMPPAVMRLLLSVFRHLKSAVVSADQPAAATVIHSS